jgi:hypothetical protein
LAREWVDVAIVARNKGVLEATARRRTAETNRRIVPLPADVTSKEQILVNSGSAPGGSTTATGRSLRRLGDHAVHLHTGQ